MEKTDKTIIETEKGFITYSFTDKDTCYIQDIFILPDFRKSNEATKLANQVVDIAKAKGCKKLLGSVVPSSKNSTDSLKVLLAYGMTLDSCTNDFILFSKSLESRVVLSAL